MTDYITLQADTILHLRDNLRHAEPQPDARFGSPHGYWERCIQAVEAMVGKCGTSAELTKQVKASTSRFNMPINGFEEPPVLVSHDDLAAAIEKHERSCHDEE